MYIRRIVLEDIRGFEQLDFNLERSNGEYSGWTVFTGDNASGKTALLKAVSMALLGPQSGRTLQPSLDGWIREGADRGTIAVQLVPGNQDRFAQGRRYNKAFWSELQLGRENGDLISVTQGQKYLRKGKGATRGPWLESPDGWFCIGYGPFRRLYGHSPEAQRVMSTPGKVSRFATMFREDATLAEGDVWLREMKYRELEGNEPAKEELQKVLALLNHRFLQHSIQIDKVDSEGLQLRQSDGVVLPLEDMSDGYRAAIAMLVDLLRQLIEVYGLEGFRPRESGEPYVDSSGVVLIDEIDAHLHPSWQRVIGDWLKTVFPNLQFLVTTHSPLICQAADDKGVFHLPPPSSELGPFQLAPMDQQRLVASRPNAILLSPAFGLKHTRSPRAVRARKEYAELKAKSAAVPLNSSEKDQLEQLSLFAKIAEDEESY